MTGAGPCFASTTAGLDVTFYGMTEFRFDDPDGNRLWIGEVKGG
jgi:hypothetical protein